MRLGFRCGMRASNFDGVVVHEELESSIYYGTENRGLYMEIPIDACELVHEYKNTQHESPPNDHRAASWSSYSTASDGCDACFLISAPGRLSNWFGLQGNTCEQYGRHPQHQHWDLPCTRLQNRE